MALERMNFTSPLCEARTPQSPVPDSPKVEVEVAEQGLAMGHTGVGWNDQLPNFRLTDELQDALDKQGVSTELVQEWAAREEKVLTARAFGDSCSSPPLTERVREISIGYMLELTRLMNLPQKIWFEAMCLLDIYCLHAPRGAKVERLPATCVALVSMLRKVDDATPTLTRANLSVHAQQMVPLLQSLGYSPNKVTEKQLDEQEWSVLQVLQWNVSLPSPESWIRTFCSRFNVLTHGLFAPSLTWVWEQSIFYVHIVLMKNVISTKLPPLHIAMGLLCLSFVGAGLLPLEVLKPPKLCTSAWELLFAKSQTKGVLPTCVLIPAHAQRVMKLIQIATDSTLPELQLVSELVAKVVAEALVDRQSSHEGHHTTL